MPYIELGFDLTDELGIKSVLINHNDTELKNDSELLRSISIAILKALESNKESLTVQDLLNELGIECESIK
jgi:hypothetical protein